MILSAFVYSIMYSTVYTELCDNILNITHTVKYIQYTIKHCCCKYTAHDLSTGLDLLKTTITN